MQIKNRGELIKLIEYFSLPKVAVEVGVAEGRFSRQLFDSGFDILYLVDLWEEIPFIDGCASFSNEWHDENYRTVLDIMKDGIAQEKVVALKGFSHKMAPFVSDNSCGLVYIDADHSYQGTKSDIKVWWSKLAPGGIMAFHDYANPDYGVNRAVIEFVQGEHNVNRIEEDGRIENIGAWIRK
jgi:hypothetical protein